MRVDFTEFYAPRVTSLTSNMFEKVAGGIKLAHGEVSAQLTYTSNFWSADSSRVRQA